LGLIDNILPEPSSGAHSEPLEAAKTLKEFEAQLSPQTFFRCHKSFLINGIHIQKQKEGNVLELSGHNEVVISRRKKSEFKTWLANLQGMIRSRDFSYASFV
ncbi:MAG: LytTR family transcriptional regulator DNA-binding domain-containing protein, partial [Bacteroidota bacterium]